VKLQRSNIDWKERRNTGEGKKKEMSNVGGEEYHHEREEDHIRIENELHEQHLRDSHQQERTDQMIQIALSGLFTYMGMKLSKRGSEDEKSLKS
jgi:hypothetical protein